MTPEAPTPLKLRIALLNRSRVLPGVRSTSDNAELRNALWTADEARLRAIASSSLSDYIRVQAAAALGDLALLRAIAIWTDRPMARRIALQALKILAPTEYRQFINETTAATMARLERCVRDEGGQP